MSNRYYGQHYEDVFIETLFPGKNNGVCVDVGAYDGVNMSNTYYFEKKGWKCVCIEPINFVFEKCKNIRKECYNYCIGERDEEKKEFTIFHLVNDNTSAISSLQTFSN